MKLQYATKKHWRRSIFDAQTIADGKKILELTDFGANFSSQKSKYLSSYLMHLIGDRENREKFQLVRCTNKQIGRTILSQSLFIRPATAKILLFAAGISVFKKPLQLAEVLEGGYRCSKK